MSKTNRRDLLKAGLGAAAVAAVPTALLAEKIPLQRPYAPLAVTSTRLPGKTGLHSIGILAQEQWDEVAELIRFYQAVLELRPDHKIHYGYESENPREHQRRHIWTAEQEYNISEPVIPVTHIRMQYGSVDNLRFETMAVAIAEQMQLVPQECKVVKKFPPRVHDITKHHTHRSRRSPLVAHVTSPTYVIDVCEPGFGPRTTAMALMECIMGCWAAWSENAFYPRQTGLTLVTPLQFQAVRNAYMLELTAYGTGIMDCDWDLPVKKEDKADVKTNKPT